MTITDSEKKKAKSRLNKKQVRDDLEKWSKWRNYDPSRRLQLPRESVYLKDRNKFHEGDDPLEQMIENKICQIGEIFPDCFDFAIKYYVDVDALGVRYAIEEVAKQMGISKTKARETNAILVGFLVADVTRFHNKVIRKAA